MQSLSVLAEELLGHAKVLDAALAERVARTCGNELDMMAELPLELQSHRKQMDNATTELQALLRGPAMSTLRNVMAWSDLLSLQVVYRYKLAAAVPLDGFASYAEIANASGLNEELCCRYLNVAISVRVFTQDFEGNVRHTPPSRMLATNKDFNDAISFQTSDLAPAGAYVLDSWERWGQDATEPTQIGLQIANNTDLSAFALWAQYPEHAARFGGAMRFFITDDSWDLRHILRSYDWRKLDAVGAHIIDVGGGVGAVSQFLARNTKSLTFEIEDLPHVTSQFEKPPVESNERVSYVAHDFFEPQSVELKADVFLLRWVLHDWADVYVIKILKALIPALHAGSRVLIYEYVLPDTPTTAVWERFGFQLDLMMGAAFNGKERTQSQYAELLAQADPRFLLEHVHKPEGSIMSLIEVSWRDFES